MSQHSRRQIIKSGAAGIALTGLAGCTGDSNSNGSGNSNENDGGSDFPSEDLEVIVPFPEGGAADAYARNTWPHATENLGVNVQVVNQPGSASLRGAGNLMNAEPDGYTIGNWNPGSTPLSYMIYQPDGFDLREAKGVCQTGRINYVLLANSSIEAEGFEDVLNRYQNGEITQLAAQEKGGIMHVLSLIMKSKFDFDWETYVGYAGSPPVVESVASNEVSVGIAADGAAQGIGDEVDVVASLGSSGSSIFPDAPIITENGYENIDYVSQLGVGFFAPPETPDDRIQIWADAIEEIIDTDEVRQWSEETGFALDFAGPDGTDELNMAPFEQIPENVDLEEIRSEVEGA